MKKDVTADADMIKRVNPKTFEVRSAETVAFGEVLGGEKFQLIHSPFRGAAAYVVYE